MDPKGVIQGPFSSKEVLKWADAGFFTPDQQVETSNTPITPLTWILPASAPTHTSEPLRRSKCRMSFPGLPLHAGAASWRGEVCVPEGLHARAAAGCEGTSCRNAASAGRTGEPKDTGSHLGAAITQSACNYHSDALVITAETQWRICLS